METIYPTQGGARLPNYQDHPPMEWTFRRLAESSVLSVHCSWTNTSDKEVKFPHEMCAAFGHVEDVRAQQGVFPTEDTSFYCIQ